MGGIIGAGASLIGGLSGLFGGGGNPVPTIPQLPGMTGAANATLSGIGSLPGTQLGGYTLPLATQTASNLYNNPGIPGYLAGASTAGGLGQNAALQQYYGGQSLFPLAGSIVNTSFDPQNQLYQQLLDRTIQTQNVQNANAGVATTPYGAGMTDQDITNFNIAWENAQLGRQLQGAQGAESLLGAGASLMGGAPGQYLAGSAMPYGAYNTVGQGQFGALTGLQGVGSGAQGLAQTPVQDYLGYIGAGQNQQAQQLQAQQQLFKQNQIYGGEIGAGLQGIFGGGYNPYGGYGGGTGWLANQFGWGQPPAGYYGGSPATNWNLQPYDQAA